ncbi:MAG: SLC13 family permease [Nitrosomonas sp.]
MKTPSLPLVNLIGGDTSQRIVFGFICACATLSMWISNTATALMMLPLGLAVIDQNQDKKIALPLLLRIAYGCSIGCET